jgi:hypothetical protein
MHGDQASAKGRWLLHAVAALQQQRHLAAGTQHSLHLYLCTAVTNTLRALHSQTSAMGAWLHRAALVCCGSIATAIASGRWPQPLWHMYQAAVSE